MDPASPLATNPSGSLDQLNPIVAPDAVGLLPLAPGWQVLLVVFAVAIFLVAWRRWLAWRDDRYRREALRLLDRMPDAAGIPDLLRRAALSAFPRARVAPLTGPAWHRFLDETAGQDLFSGEAGAWLDRLAYGGAPLDAVQGRRLEAAARTWLRTHRREA